MKLTEIYSYLSENSIKELTTSNEPDLKNFLESESKYLYLIIWSEESEVFSWGTMSKISDRIRKSSLLSKKLTGKYDRRVDYLMLKKLYPTFSLKVYETEKSLILENHLKQEFNQRHCHKGIKGNNRDEISMSIYSRFKGNDYYKRQSDSDKILFDEFFHKIFLGKLRHPNNPKRTFYWGDCLEPKFLRTIGKQKFEPVIERVLDVHFYNEVL
jgi:hypothetical protein